MATNVRRYTPGTTVEVGSVISSGLSRYNSRACVMGTYRDTANVGNQGSADNDRIYEVVSLADANQKFGPHSDIHEFAAGWFQKNTSSFQAISVRHTANNVTTNRLLLEFDMTAFNSSNEYGVYSFYVDGRKFNAAKVQGSDFNAFRDLIFSHLGSTRVYGVEKPAGEANQLRIISNYNVWAHKGVHNVYFPADDVLGVKLNTDQEYFSLFDQSAAHPHDYSATLDALREAQFDVIYTLYDQDLASMLIGEQTTDNFAAGVVGNASVMMLVDPHSLRYDRQVAGGATPANARTALSTINFFDPNGADNFEIDFLAFSGASNDARLTPFTRQGSMEHPYRYMGELGGTVKTYQDADLSNTLTGRVFTAYDRNARDFTPAERENLLKNGFSTFKVVQGGLAIERLRTVYTKRPGVGDFDDSTLSDFRNVSALLFIRRDLQAHLSGLYANYTIGQNGVNYGSQNVVTLEVIAGEIIARHDNWLSAALVRATPEFAPSVQVTEATGGQINVCFKVLLTDGLYVLNALMNIQQSE